MEDTLVCKVWKKKKVCVPDFNLIRWSDYNLFIGKCFLCLFFVSSFIKTHTGDFLETFEKISNWFYKLHHFKKIFYLTRYKRQNKNIF